MTLSDVHKTRTNPIARLHRLSPEQGRLLARASVILSAASAVVALLPFRRAIRFGCVRPRPGNRMSVADCVWAVEAAARRLPWRTMCIEQGLAAQRLLRASGTDAVLHYGARHDSRTCKLEAHVWVSVGGKVILGGGEAAEFAEIAVYP
jgi:hypothetical protein